MIIEFIGYAGAIIILVCYIALTKQWVDNKSIYYFAPNSIGAFCLCINAFYHESYPLFIINLIFTFVGIYGIKKNSK